MSLVKKIPLLTMLAGRSLRATPEPRHHSTKRIASAPSPHRSDLVHQSSQKEGRYGKEEFSYDLKHLNIGLLLGLVGAKTLHVAAKEEVEWTWK
ncbi:hypothetical protein CBER1_11431 [Cercospora berteroae]|uniref:Uncharacterized protein n=1 Tax=Cercospora berteroae TaxID=357750 RepID=A0A2S6BZR0_9PEZI|nr:hypothetical protein CBER1_11431 [Cercospora berteroae]